MAERFLRWLRRALYGRAYFELDPGHFEAFLSGPIDIEQLPQLLRKAR